MTKRNLIVSDFHIPDHHKPSLELLYKFIPQYRPTTVHILGDFVNFATVSKYEQDPFYRKNLSDEIREAHDILRKIVDVAKCEVIWYSGNHEDRLLKYLKRNAAQLADLSLNDEYVVSIPHLFQLKELGVSYVGRHFRNGVLFEHGELIRSKSGMTAHSNLDKNGVSTIGGHTHRLALVFKKTYDKQIFGIENGCLCNYKPTPFYGSMVKDWELGFSTVDIVDGIAYPRLYPIINNSIQR